MSALTRSRFDNLSKHISSGGVKIRSSVEEREFHWTDAPGMDAETLVAALAERLTRARQSESKGAAEKEAGGEGWDWLGVGGSD